MNDQIVLQFKKQNLLLNKHSPAFESVIDEWLSEHPNIASKIAAAGSLAQQQHIKKQAIDEVYKNSQNLEETGEKIKTILGEESEERNPFLVDYNNIARITKEIDIIHKELVQDKLRADDFREESTLVKDSETKAAIVGKLTDVQNRIAEKNKKIVDKQKEIQELTTEHQEKMSQMKEDMEEYIKKISETEKK